MAEASPNVWTMTYPDKFISWMDAIPVVDHDRERHQITVDQPDAKTVFYYELLEEGCYLFLVDINAKEDTFYRIMGDLETEYYTLSFQHALGQFSKKPANIVTQQLVQEKVLSLPSICYFFNNLFNYESSYTKDANVKTLMFCFKKEWLEKAVDTERADSEAAFMKVLHKQMESLAFLNDTFYKDTLQELLHLLEARPRSVLYNLLLRKLSLTLIANFLTIVLEPQSFVNINPKPENITGVNKIKEYLDTHFFQGFPGLEELAEIGNMTVATMRRQFMSLFGRSAFDYFNEVQMRYAYSQLEQGASTKEISISLGFMNTGNFTRRFKKRYNLLPTEVKQLLAEQVH